MRNKKTFLKSAALFLILSVSFISCTKDNQEPVYQNYISKELALQLTKEYLLALVDVVSATNPEAAEIKPLIISDITVYKIVYKTKVNNQDINASGLVCVPVSPGYYPVLSFQNGTNTVNSLAPSQFPSDYSYQMIELIASMGFIVVISDYPGFGASSTIPHPYLVKEPTVRALTDNLYAVKELVASELPDINLINDYYLLGYSQGGWATLALGKALETEFSSDFNLIGSACGAGPYDIHQLLHEMINVTTYPMPVYLGFIVNAYTAYDQFTNPVTDLFNEPYASRISSLYTGVLTSSEINGQLTTSIPDLITPAFLSGFETDPSYASVRTALDDNSIQPWHTYKPLLLLHGSADTHVNPISTENIYNGMIEAGTSADICKKVIITGADHGSGIVPAMLEGILFLNDLKISR
jgi:pimeloyl-ACP methyl ester carboxylesterase